MGLSGLHDDFLRIPVVNNLKILGHYHGKDKLICEFNNFHSKLSKMQKIINIWKQRPLTLIGKNMLINSSFLFNAQIEIPPPDFIRLVDKQSNNKICFAQVFSSVKIG